MLVQLQSVTVGVARDKAANLLHFGATQSNHSG
jgi:hypothetical protein